ncbi:hypothetical protein L873DRAFT_1818825 [Choiromyces venosus 120613-1]|uniref:Uncharacterized protein n=1 Tax=Choiromyces venosus 120613-1 TaxID=1336337 RepID=A0A3N4J5C5_9PEZI|nr:hypothetical protein L873DRAFT_1818825 [Choiromyces venosus 120613-1]
MDFVSYDTHLFSGTVYGITLLSLALWICPFIGPSYALWVSNFNSAAGVLFPSFVP